MISTLLQVLVRKVSLVHLSAVYSHAEHSC